MPYIDLLLEIVTACKRINFSDLARSDDFIMSWPEDLSDNYKPKN